MSTIIASNISDGTTSVGTGYVVNGSAKAWCTLDMTTAALDASFNCSSLTDIAVGRFTIDLTASMSATSYAVVSSCISTKNLNTGANRTAGSTSYTASSMYVNAMVTSTGANNDTEANHLVAHGDLA
jgi:hypothetical protein